MTAANNQHMKHEKHPAKEQSSWLRRRNAPDWGSMKIPKKQGRLIRKLINILRRTGIFFMSILYRKYCNSPAPDLNTIRSVLIIPHDPIGDLVLTSPVWEILRRKNPGLHIGIAASARNKDVLLQENIDITYDFYSPGRLRILREMRKARKDGWDVVLATAGFYKPTRYAFLSRFVARNGITATMNSARHERYGKIYSLCFYRQPPWELVPMTDQYISLVEKTFNIEIPREERTTHFRISPEIGEQVSREISELLVRKHASGYILINLEAKVPHREWGFENVRMITEKSSDRRSDLLIVLIASVNFRFYYQKEMNRISGANVVVFETETIHHVAALIQKAALVISPDTAIVHIAAALRKKLIAFYPAPDEWLPYSAHTTILYPERWMPISTISADKVFSEAVALIES